MRRKAKTVVIKTEADFLKHFGKPMMHCQYYALVWNDRIDPLPFTKKVEKSIKKLLATPKGKRAKKKPFGPKIEKLLKEDIPARWRKVIRDLDKQGDASVEKHRRKDAAAMRAAQAMITGDKA